MSRSTTDFQPELYMMQQPTLQCPSFLLFEKRTENPVTDRLSTTGTVPQSLRGMPGGFGGQQQQPQQSGRGASGRLPNGKLASVAGASGWAFGTGVPMSASTNGPPGSARQMGGNISFAQSLSGSQPATPLDPSEFPSLSNTSQLPSANQSSMWSAAGSRNLGGGTHRGGGTPISSQQAPQDDMFTSSRLPSATQGAFRFGNQLNATLVAQVQASPADDFPPLNRNANGEIGGQISAMGFGSGSATQTNRAGNGLLNALSANSRAAEARSPTSVQRPQDLRSPIGEDEGRQKPPGYREESVGDSGSQGLGNRNPLGAIGNDPPTGKAKEEENGHIGDVQDPLEGMAPIDKFGLKGVRTLMNNFQDYNALTMGIDPTTLGLDLTSTELLSTQVFSLFNDTPPRPPVPKFRLPECYHVKNVQSIEAKIQSFNEETLMWIFYSCPRDIKQQLAALELNNRNWRWHKKMQIWLTKDDMMTPQSLSPNHERGYYIIWDAPNWRKDRRELTLHYSDLDTTTTPAMQALAG
ncbi:hypothetical protein B0H66DRAFT_557418 [Apodospora peruviana]|uniref:NOT2/NOT3/NOT5 C-terminal domain-containing protein n=1 Tax=Apodospora peruviana TaxID=516989 RepID=A0AAE0I6F8_9PEZI|nr:hypothetical protein B0H66DRAFT_557418 [Apodospora peruviana]